MFLIVSSLSFVAWMRTWVAITNDLWYVERLAVRNWTLHDVPKFHSTTEETRGTQVQMPCPDRPPTENNQKGANTYPAQLSGQLVHANTKPGKLCPQLVDKFSNNLHNLDVNTNDGHGGRVFENAVLDCQAAIVNNTS
jgi:hypothetical protein